MTSSSSSSFFSGINSTPTEYQTSVDLVAQATEKAAASLASANSSAASATSSQNYSIAAGNSATSAANQAASAATSATNAATSASSASSSAATATTKATTATNQATTATTQATNSATSASASSASATAAATSATNAASSATAAATSASNAAATLAGAMVKTNNLSDVSNASTARTNLGVAIGSNVQAWDADLDAIAALAGTSGLLKKTAANTWSLDTTSYLSGTVPVANGGTGGTTSTGSGSVVLANSPTLVTPALGTPSSGNLGNCTFPTLNQNTTGTAANVTGTVAVANGGTGLSTLTAGYIPFGAGTSAFGNSANLFWDNANGRLGIGTSSPSQKLDVNGTIWNKGGANVGSIGMLQGNTSNTGSLGFYDNSNNRLGYSGYADNTGGTIRAMWGESSTNGMVFGTNNQERLRIDSSGNVGLGAASQSSISLYFGGNAPAVAQSRAFQNGQVITSSSTTNYMSFNSYPSVQDAAFTLPNLFHFAAGKSSFGASATVTNQFGYLADATLTGATNNYGFYSNIASGTGRWNFYANGTADNYFAGNVGIGTSSPNGKFHVVGDISRFTSANAFMPQITAHNQNNGTSGPYFVVRKSRATSGASAAVQVGDYLGTLIFSGSDINGADQNAAYLSCTASAVGAGNVDGNMQFFSYGTAGTMSFSCASSITMNSTAASSAINAAINVIFSTAGQERLRIDSSGRVGLGVTPSAARALTITTSLTGSTQARGIVLNSPIQSDVTSDCQYFRSNLTTAAASFTLTGFYHYGAYQTSIGAGSSITTQYGYFADSSITGATNNYGFYSDIASGTGRWNFYAAGTAANYFGGVVEMKNVSAAPTSIAAGNGVLYVEAGALKYRGSSGTVTTIAAA